MKLRTLIAGLMFGVAAFAADTGAELFQKAVTQENAAGNLEEAIKLYQRVATEFASDRALAAKALVQEGRCYEKLGQDKAVKLYEQVARDFKDQRDPAAMASARLATLRHADQAQPPATMMQRKIELPSTASFSDGRRLVYNDLATGVLMISDLDGKDKRVIFKPKEGRVWSFMPSRDLSMELMVLNRPDGSSTTAVIKADGTAYREVGGSPNFNLCSATWSWDNRYVLMCGAQPGVGRQLLRISAADGEARPLWATSNGDLRYSPDGRFIAGAQGGAKLGKIFVAPSQGGEQQLVSGNARLQDWTRDGRYLAVSMERSGTEALYLIPMKDGRPEGEPVFVRYGTFGNGLTVAGGGLAYLTVPPNGLYKTWLGELDSDRRLGEWKPLSLSGSSSVSPYVRWSSDSTQISYTTADQAAGQSTWTIRLRNMASGEEREIYRGVRTVCVWATQHPNLFCSQEGDTPQATRELLSIAIDSGAVERLGSLPADAGPYYASRDDRAIYMSRSLGDGFSELFRWDIGTHQAASLEHIPSLDRGVPIFGEHWLARRVNGVLSIRLTAGGDWRPIGSFGRGGQSGFTADGTWLLYHDVDAAGKQSLFRAPTAGGQPERIGDFPCDCTRGSLWVSPDGRKIIASTSVTPEAWLLENYEPKQQAAK